MLHLRPHSGPRSPDDSPVAVPRRAVLFWVGAAVATTAVTGGCGYIVGPAHDDLVCSVEVPTFRNETFRRGLEQQLTEAVQKEIQKRTTIQLVRGQGAQTRLTGRIVDARKSVLGETASDDPREVQFSLAVEVSWEDLRTGRIINEQTVPIDADAISLFSQSEFAPEVGHSLATAIQGSVQLTARRIVDLMDAPW
jgi:hypothetical protein